MTQLKTQITDLERFIDFLQGEATSPGPYAQKLNCSKCSHNESAFPIFNVKFTLNILIFLDTFPFFASISKYQIF